ncbi:N-acetylglucosamine-6-phosphate deacetylase [Serinibacter salmoneus]|uniref:N-acetylglucosamine-6-phosphate deacetylase n=1 Tax=Serinibacter salmoneus TaxID=556530 RepID=A0A2A9D1S8_9MICO|nr:N-acetylglucosamine-6-phosphate deacetylase [Serinibacter salmoneus]PFG19902.1 N-acetylglucosamine-6-phosphate deacetylase [Serinibacter salmoneus]
MLIHAERALIDGRIERDVRVRVEAGRIADVTVGGVPGETPGEASGLGASQTPDVHLTSGVLTPGLLDVQNNGSFGADFADAGAQQWRTVLDGLARRGVTAVQPTVITAPPAELHGAFERVLAAQRTHDGQARARVLGAHLEGPFISPERKGAHRVECMLDPTGENLAAVLDHEAARAIVTTVTLAPELPHALEAIAAIAARGIVVAVGHSDATAAQVRAAGDAGATMTTHIFNAQRPLSHREPGVPGAVLADERFHVGTIIDGLHLDPTTVRLVRMAAPDRWVGVTDAIVTAGLPPGTPLTFGGQGVMNDDEGLGRRQDGTIAGAGIVLDEGVRRMIAAGLEPEAVLTACTRTAADSVRRDDLGRLAAGGLADLVWWDEHWFPQRVWVGGRDVA